MFDTSYNMPVIYTTQYIMAPPIDTIHLLCSAHHESACTSCYCCAEPMLHMHALIQSITHTAVSGYTCFASEIIPERVCSCIYHLLFTCVTLYIQCKPAGTSHANLCYTLVTCSLQPYFEGMHQFHMLHNFTVLHIG